MTHPAGAGKPKKIHHWKHGWIPLDAYARGILADKKKTPHDKARAALATQHAPVDRPTVQPTSTGASSDPVGDMQAKNRIFDAIDKYRNGGRSPTPLEYSRMSLSEKLNLEPLSTDKNPPESYADRFLVKNKIRKDPDRSLRPRPITIASSDQPDLLNAIKKNGGFTYDPKKGGLLEVGKAHGLAVGVPGTEQIVGGESVSREDFAKGVAAVILEHGKLFDQGAVLGGWYSPERNQYMVEVSQILPPKDRDFAIRLAKARNQEAVFDLSTGDIINTGGTGDAPQIDADRAAARNRAAHMLAQIDAVEKPITMMLKDQAAEAGGTMEGLDFRVKEAASLEDKLVWKAAQKGISPDEVHIGDALRYTVAFPPDVYAARAQKLFDDFTARGFTITEADNIWLQPTYKGINAQVLDPSGQEFELQIHTPESFRIKMGVDQHADYKVVSDPTQPFDAQQAAKQRMMQRWQHVSIPPDVTSVGNLVNR